MRFVMIAFLVVLGAVEAQAQSADVRPLYDRIDRLERDLQTLQSQLARTGGLPVVVNSPAAQLPSGQRAPLGAAGTNLGGLPERMDDLEDQLRTLTGKVEEAGHQASQTATKLDRFMADADLRLKELSDQLRALQPPPAATPTDAQDSAAPAASMANNGKKTNIPNNSAENPGLAPGPQVLGTISAKDIKKSQAAVDQLTAAVTNAAAPKDPKAAYDAAYALFQSNDYDGATDAFKGFLAKFPEHQLAPSALYWIGESAYAQKDYKAALTSFAEGYKKFPNSSKAPDLLFKMGQSFEQLGMTKQACGSYKLLFEDHADMPDRVKKAANAAKAKTGC